MVFLLFLQSQAVCSSQHGKICPCQCYFWSSQGSVLGPLLFLIFVNDLPKDITVPIRFFADDCVMYKTVRSPTDQSELNLNLQKIQNWCTIWQMDLNAAKTVTMTVTRKKRILNTTYSINDHELGRVEQHKYLGLLITSDLRWNLHVDSVCAKANKALWRLRRNLHHASPEIKCLAYKALVRPIMEYAKVVWDPYTTSNRTKLDRIQRLASRFIFNKYQRCHSPTQLCKLAHLEPLEQRTEYERLKLLFLIIKEQVKIDKSKYMYIKTGETSRHRHNMYIPPPRSHNDCFKFSFFPRAISEWNRLPNSTVLSECVPSFLKGLKDVVYKDV